MSPPGRQCPRRGWQVPRSPTSPTQVSPARRLRVTVVVAVVLLWVMFGVRHLFLQAVLLLCPPRAGTPLQDVPHCPVGASSELSTSRPHACHSCHPSTSSPQRHAGPGGAASSVAGCSRPSHPSLTEGHRSLCRGPPAAPKWGGGQRKHLRPPGLPWWRLGSYLEAAEDSVEVVESQDTVVDSQEAKEPGSANN